MKPLYKNTIIIWSEFDPTPILTLEDLAREAVDGSMYCSSMKSQLVENPLSDSDWDGTEFFNDDCDDYDDDLINE